MPGFEWVGKEELQMIERLFEEGKGNLYRYGPNHFVVDEFEKAFADYMGVTHAHALSSGTAAIHAALAATGVGPGDEVITTAFTFVAPVEAIVALGATPVPVEIDETYHLDPKAVAAALTSKTKAVVSIPMWAAPHMNEIVEVCSSNSIALIEDSAQCLGGSYQGKKLGTFGQVASFSFDMGKSMTTGEGGMVITNDEEIYRRVAEFSDHGHMHEPGIPRGKDPRRAPGLNYRMSELAGAVGLAQLSKLDELLEKHAQTKAYIKNGLKEVSGVSFRAFSDEAGSLGDTLIMHFASPEKASSVANILLELGFNSKILPEAFSWHFAGHWGHIFKGHTQDALINRWPKTYRQLLSSVALPIMFKMDRERQDGMIAAIKKAVNAN